MRNGALGVLKERRCPRCAVLHTAKRSDTQCIACKQQSAKAAKHKYKQVHRGHYRVKERLAYDPLRRRAKHLRKRQRLLDSQCHFCSTTERLTIDHIIPQSLGGSENRRNLRTLCLSCNAARKNKMDQRDKPYLRHQIANILYARLHDLRVATGLHSYGV